MCMLEVRDNTWHYQLSDQILRTTGVPGPVSPQNHNQPTQLQPVLVTLRHGDSLRAGEQKGSSCFTLGPALLGEDSLVM